MGEIAIQIVFIIAVGAAALAMLVGLLVLLLRRPRIGVPIVLVLVILAVFARHSYTAKYPYGYSHCCIDGMMFALEEYARNHGGAYPVGGTSPEASLSLLYKSKYIDAYTLRGMTVSERTVRRVLEGGGLLGPDTCGWHYTEGLTFADDDRLALLYCKQPLEHNGQRSENGGRQVVRVHGDIDFVSGRQWTAFLKEQQELLSHRDPRALTGTPLVAGSIELPDGTHIDHVDAPYTMREELQGSNRGGNGTSSGGGLDRSHLVWYQAPFQDGYVIRTLSFSNLVSDPVAITFVKGVPNVTNFVFRMRNKP